MVEKYTLTNGIPVFIVETHTAPVVSVQLWVHRGSAYEKPQLAGISHFLEHALFKGTRKRTVGEIAKEIESRGGEINAFTSFEETCYYATLASRYFEDGLDILSDAIQSPRFDAVEMEREKEVILEEIRRANDSSFKTLSTNLWATAFAGTPFGRPVLGFERTVRHINATTLRQYFEQHYHAGTVALFIVGDVSSAEAKKLAARKLRRMRRGKATSLPKSLKIPSLKSPKVVCISRSISEFQAQVGFRAPHFRSPLIPALDLACTAIGQGESGRLYQKLIKEKELAQEVHMGLVATSRCGLATLTLVTSEDKIGAALEECRAVLDAAATSLDDEELERVKSSLEAEVIGGKETVEGYARRLGYYYCQFGDPEYEKKYLEQVLAVDTEEAQEALASVLKEMPVLSLATPKQVQIAPQRLASAIRPKARIKPPRPQPAHAPEVKTAGTLRFVTQSIDALPIVSLKFIFPGGSREESPGQLGIGTLFQRVWTSGTRSYSALQIAETLESLGASISAFCGRNTLGLSVEFLSKHWTAIKPLISEILLEPTFPEEELSTEKKLLLQEIATERDSPAQLCQLNFMELLYGAHPYGRSSLGKIETITPLTAADLKDFHQAFVHQGSAVISTVGKVKGDRWNAELSQLCAFLPQTGRSARPPFAVQASEQLKAVTATKEPLFQTQVMVGFLGATLHSKERYALKILSSCLAGQGGRLFLELRDKQSLAYQVQPIVNDSPEPGVFAFYIGCAPEKLGKALLGIRREIEKLHTERLSSKELDRAKRYWIGRFELDKQRFSSQAMLYGLDEVYGLGASHSLRAIEQVKALTADHIRDAAQQYLLTARPTISVVHPTALSEAWIADAWAGKAVDSRPEVGRKSTEKPEENATVPIG